MARLLPVGAASSTSIDAPVSMHLASAPHIDFCILLCNWVMNSGYMIRPPNQSDISVGLRLRVQ